MLFIKLWNHQRLLTYHLNSHFDVNLHLIIWICSSILERGFCVVNDLRTRVSNYLKCRCFEFKFLVYDNDQQSTLLFFVIENSTKDNLVQFFAKNRLLLLKRYNFPGRFGQKKDRLRFIYQNGQILDNYWTYFWLKNRKLSGPIFEKAVVDENKMPNSLFLFSMRTKSALRQQKPSVEYRFDSKGH